MLMKNIKFLDQIAFFNPEPQIVASRQEAPITALDNLSRHITWQALDRNGKIVGPFYDLATEPFSKPLELIVEAINAVNFLEYLNDVNPLPRSLINFQILKIEWYIRTFSERNVYAPHYAPKRLDAGLKFEMDSEGITASFQAISRSIWHNFTCNPTQVVPVTAENFAKVIKYQRETAEFMLKEMLEELKTK